MVLRRLPGRFPGLALATISLLATGRYARWRLHNTLEFDSLVEAFWLWSVGRRGLHRLVVVLGFTVGRPLKRRPAELSEDTSDWPTVDVFIPTYNEPRQCLAPDGAGCNGAGLAQRQIAGVHPG